MRQDTTLAELLGGFAGLRVLVVGGGGGIGAEVVAQAGDLGAQVVSASRSGPPPDLAVPPPPHGGVASSVAVDLEEPNSIRRLASWIEGAWGGLDILVNTAGLTWSVPLDALDRLDDGLIDRVMTTNATGILRVIRDLAPALRLGSSPCIVNVSSVAARTGVGSSIAYVGAKAAMDAMTVSLAKALAPAVRLVNVAPSALATDFVKNRPPQFIERTIAATPLGRLASPREVANAVLIAARLLTMTTGSTVYVDGGRHL